MTRIEVSRHAAADPASVALLMSEPPTAQDPERAWVVAPPLREGATFIAAAQSSVLAGFMATGELTIEPAAGGECDLRLVLDVSADVAASRAQRSASRFLATIAYRARSRSFAA